MLNRVAYCDPNGWSEDRWSEGDTLVLIRDPDPLERAVSMDACLPQNVPARRKTQVTKLSRG